MSFVSLFQMIFQQKNAKRNTYRIEKVKDVITTLTLIILQFSFAGHLQVQRNT